MFERDPRRLVQVEIQVQQGYTQAIALVGYKPRNRLADIPFDEFDPVLVAQVSIVVCISGVFLVRWAVR